MTGFGRSVIPSPFSYKMRGTMQILKRKIKTCRKTKRVGGKDIPLDIHTGKRIFQNQLLCPHYLDNCQLGLQCSPGPHLIVSG